VIDERDCPYIDAMELDFTVAENRITVKERKKT
jgi:hypothetical protein